MVEKRDPHAGWNRCFWWMMTRRLAATRFDFNRCFACLCTTELLDWTTT